MARRTVSSKVQTPLDILSQDGGAHQPLEAFIPQTVQPVLRDQVAGQLQLFANHKELARQRPLPCAG